jgi:hypothetical protein
MPIINNTVGVAASCCWPAINASWVLVTSYRVDLVDAFRDAAITRLGGFVFVYIGHFRLDQL